MDDVTVRWAPVEAGRTGDDPRTAVAHRRVASPLGEVVLVGTGDTLTALHLPTSAPPDPAGIGPEDPDLLMSAVRQLDEYFAGTRTRFDLALAPLGTAFQHRVWRRLLAIPHGRTCSYGEVAEDVGGPRSTRAVGSANGSNPIAIVIPCHRVIGADGTLVGYAGGLAAKRFLLDLESGTRPLFDPGDVA